MATTSVSHNLDEIRNRVRVSSAPKLGSFFGVVAVGAIVGSIAMAMSGEDGFRRLSHSTLLNGWFAVSISLGAMFFIAIQHLVRAGWSVTTRRICEVLAASIGAPLLLMSPLLVALMMGDSSLFPWNDPEVVAGDKILKGKSAYLNDTFFAARAVGYALFWVWCGRWYLRSSEKQDVDRTSKITLRLEGRSAPVLLFLGLTTTFAAFDWLMSLDPHWFSTIFGIYAFSGAITAALAVVAIVAAVLVRTKVTPAITSEHLHDVVKFMYGMNCFWAYIAFSQYLLIWYANIPEETVWLKHRKEYGWEGVGHALAVGHFIIPFIVLMPRAAKRNTLLVIVMSIGILAMHWLDLYWIVYPQFEKAPVFGALEIVSAIAFIAAFGWLSIRKLRGSTFVPIHDPRLNESVAHVVH